MNWLRQRGKGEESRARQAQCTYDRHIKKGRSKRHDDKASLLVNTNLSPR